VLDWAARIDDLAALLATEYRMEDRQALEVLLAALAPCPRTDSLWLVLETNYYSRVCAPAWFSFGETWEPKSLAQIRARNPWREIEYMVSQILELPDELQLFVEPDFQRYPHYARLANAHFILDRCPRVRTILTRANTALMTIDALEAERHRMQLAAATRMVLEDRVHSRPDGPPKFIEPPEFSYRVELVERLSVWYRDWQILVKAMALLGVRHAWLYGRRETDERDWEVMARAMADSVPPWITTAIELLLEGPAQPRTLERHMRLDEERYRSGHGAHRELNRLHRRGLITWDRERMHWIIRKEHRQALDDIIHRRAFGAALASHG
jgi:hypothetical protein